MNASIKNDFKRDKYVIMRKVISDDTLELIINYLSMLHHNNHFSPDKYFPKTRYLDLVMQSLLVQLQKKIEVVAEVGLYPSYSHLRVYSPGDYLPPHTDREACEYSATLALNYDCESIWPIFVMNGEQKVNAYLDRGDMLIYKGCEVTHGRDVFQGKSWTQVFFHYVDQLGPYKEWKYDKNPSIAYQPS